MQLSIETDSLLLPPSTTTSDAQALNYNNKSNIKKTQSASTIHEELIYPWTVDGKKYKERQQKKTTK